MWKCREVSILGMTIYQWEKEAEENHQINFYPWPKVSYMTNNRLHAFIEQWRAYFIEQWRVVPMLSGFSHVWPFGPSLPGSSVHGILQARTLEQVAVPSSRGCSQPRAQTHICYVYLPWQWVLYDSTSWEAPRRVHRCSLFFLLSTFSAHFTFSSTSLLWIVPSNKALACEICHRLCFLENLD